MLASHWPVVVVVSLLLAAVLLPSTAATSSCNSNTTINTDGWFRPTGTLTVAAGKLLYVPISAYYYTEGARFTYVSVLLDETSCRHSACDNQLILGLYNGTSGKLLAQTQSASFRNNKQNNITLALSPQPVVPPSTISTPYILAINTLRAYSIQSYSQSGYGSSGISSHAWQEGGSLPSHVANPSKQSKPANAAFQAMLCFPSAQ